MVTQGSTSERISQRIIRSLGRHPQNFRQPCPRPKTFKVYRFEGATNYKAARSPHMSRASTVLKKVYPRVWAAFISLKIGCSCGLL
jgi:hypothetical protein